MAPVSVVEQHSPTILIAPARRVLAPMGAIRRILLGSDAESIGGLSSEALIRVSFDGTSAREAERFDMDARIREVEEGPDGAIWLLEDGRGGRLLKLTPTT